jgi:hypothetical protein
VASKVKQGTCQCHRCLGLEHCTEQWYGPSVIDLSISIKLICITGAAAAQVVPHVHFHIIPRPLLTPELRNKSFTMFGRGQRSERDDDEAAALAKSLREELAREVERIQSREKL